MFRISEMIVVMKNNEFQEVAGNPLLGIPDNTMEISDVSPQISLRLIMSLGTINEINNRIREINSVAG